MPYICSNLYIMSTKQLIVFIINPISGSIQKANLPQLISSHIDYSRYDVQVRFTEYAGHAPLLAQQAVAEGASAVIAVGGDGSVNEVANQLVGSPAALGIVPLGSGNGFANTLQLPREPAKALHIINAFHTRRIDVGKMNDRYFFSCAGMGWEATVIDDFAETHHRSLFQYLRMATAAYFRTTPATFTLKANNKVLKMNALSINVGNSGQLGYGITITPFSKLDDGKIEIAIVRPFAPWQSPYLVLQLLRKKIWRTRTVHILQTSEAEVIAPAPIRTQIDGEPYITNTNVQFSVVPRALNVIVP